MILGIQNILFAYYIKLKFIPFTSRYYEIFSIEMFSIHRTLSVIIGFVLIIVSFNLYKRMKMAWIISVCMLSSLILINAIKFHGIFKMPNLIETIVTLILAFNYKKFKRSTDPISLRIGLKLGIISIFLISANTCFTIYVLKYKSLNVFRLGDALKSSIKMLFLMEPSVLGKLSKIEMVYIRSSIDINWIGILFVLYFVLKPLVYQPIATVFDKERVRRLLNKYGDNPTSYVSLENDKKYFFGKNTEGVIVYTIVANVSVCVGDPICCDENMPLLIAEFIAYCKNNNFEICFCETMGRHISLYKELGFSNTKYGEEAMFDLDIYNLQGKKAAKIRNAINHASALGITVEEYQPLKSRNRIIEQQIRDVSREWLKNKKSGELSFMMGTISLENPMDRRYFVAYDKDGKILGFVVFTPFQGGKGYFADVTRRRNSAPIGVMEKIMIEAFKKMKVEGVKWASLGNAPLANVGDDGGITGKLLEIIYEKFNSFYGFKNLYHYKKKYGPTSWEPKYLVYYSKIFTPQIAYAIIKAQNPKGVSDFVLSQLKAIFQT